MRNAQRFRSGIVTGLLLGSSLFMGGALVSANAEETGTPPYGPGMMRNYAQPPVGSAYGPGMMRGYGPTSWGGYGPGMMTGYGHGAWGAYGSGMMGGFGWGMMGGYGPGRMPGYGTGDWGGYGPGMMHGYGGVWRGNALKLTDKQRQRLDDIHAKASKQLWLLMGQMQEERFALARLMISHNPDMKAVDAAYDKLTQTGKKLLNLHLDTRRASWEVLTADQRKELEEQGW